MSTDLITYLNFIAGLENATDDELNDIMDERTKFIEMGRSNMMDTCSAAIDSVFDKIDSLAKQLEEEEIAEESVKLAEDAAAVAGIWSFGLSMAAFAALSVTDMVLQAEIKKKETDLNNHMANADKDIANKMGGACADYINLTKRNNNFLKASAPAGLTPQTERSYLYNYMDFLDNHGGVTLENFKKFIEVARMTKDDANINNVYNTLDMFTLSDDHGQEALKTALANIDASGLAAQQYITLIRSFTYVVWIQKMNVSSSSLKAATQEVTEIPPEEAEIGVFENMDNIGKAMAGLTIVISIVDAALNIYNIVETVIRYEENVKNIAKARQQYKYFYQHMFDASAKYQPKTGTK